jgi:hypothetical protein
MAGCPSAEGEGGEIPHGTVNKLAREARSGGTHPASRRGKAYKSGSGRKTPQERGGRPTSHVNCK